MMMIMMMMTTTTMTTTTTTTMMMMMMMTTMMMMMTMMMVMMMTMTKSETTFAFDLLSCPDPYSISKSLQTFNQVNKSRVYPPYYGVDH